MVGGRLDRSQHVPEQHGDRYAQRHVARQTLLSHTEYITSQTKSYLPYQRRQFGHPHHRRHRVSFAKIVFLSS